MTNQRLWIFLPFVLFGLILLGLPALTAAQTCQPDGDVDHSGSVTAADALLAFQQALGLAQLTACQQTIANVFPQPAAPDSNITASDALCIFRKALGLPSCLDALPSTNVAPVADAGVEQHVFGNEVVTLSGSGFDPDGMIVRYRWQQTSGPPVVLSGADTPTASFTAPEVALDIVAEELEFQLTVTDDDGASDTALVLVVVLFVSVANESPTANAGFDQFLSEDTMVTLSGSGTDPDGFVIGYFWVQVSGRPVELIGENTPNPRFVAPGVDSDEQLVFELTVFDDELAYGTDTVTITVLNSVSNIAPVADAGSDQVVDKNTPVTLSGSGTDSDGTIVSYRWTQASGTPVTLSGANTRAASFTTPDVDADEDLVFQLMVTDDGGASDVDFTTVTVRAAPVSSELREMVFENPGPGEPGYVIAGDNASLQYWFTPSGDVSQSLHEKADGTERVRTFYDSVTGAPQTVLDENSGHWLSIRGAGPDRVDFWVYDNVGNLLNAFAIYQALGRYYTAEVTGVPAHEWEPITGHLISDDASWTARFELRGDVEDGLANIQEAPPELVALIDELATLDANESNTIRPFDRGSRGHSVILAPAAFARPASAHANGYDDAENDMVLAMLNQLGRPGAFFANLYRRSFKREGPKAQECLGRQTATGSCSVFRYLGDRSATNPYDVIRSETQVRKSAGQKPGFKIASKAETRPTSLFGLPTIGGILAGFFSVQDTETLPLSGGIDSKRDYHAEGVHFQGARATELAIIGNSGRKDGTFEYGSDVRGTVTPQLPPPDEFDTNRIPSIACECRGDIDPTNLRTTDTGGIRADCGPQDVGGARCYTCSSDQKDSEGRACFSAAFYASFNKSIARFSCSDIGWVEESEQSGGPATCQPPSDSADLDSYRGSCRAGGSVFLPSEAEVSSFFLSDAEADSFFLSDSEAAAYYLTDADAIAYYPSDAEAAEYFPSDTSYRRENCGESCTALGNCYRCTSLGNSYRCTSLSNAYRCTSLSNAYHCTSLSNAYRCTSLSNAYRCTTLSNCYRCTSLSNFYNCTGSGAAATACRQERDSVVSSCRKERDEVAKECRKQRDDIVSICRESKVIKNDICVEKRDRNAAICKSIKDPYVKSCREERDDNVELCREERDTVVAACRASQ